LVFLYSREYKNKWKWHMEDANYISIKWWIK